METFRERNHRPVNDRATKRPYSALCGEDDFEEWDNDGGGRGRDDGRWLLRSLVAAPLRGSDARPSQKHCY